MDKSRADGREESKKKYNKYEEFTITVFVLSAVSSLDQHCCIRGPWKAAGFGYPSSIDKNGKFTSETASGPLQLGR